MSGAYTTPSYFLAGVSSKKQSAIADSISRVTSDTKQKKRSPTLYRLGSLNIQKVKRLVFKNLIYLLDNLIFLQLMSKSNFRHQKRF